jgi:hypothetical protein
MDPDTDKSASLAGQSVEVHYPIYIDASTSTVFLVGGYGYAFPLNFYRRIAHRFADRGYISVLLKYHWGTHSDMLCAIAWLLDQGGQYGIQPDRIVGFGHTGGGFGLIHYGLSATDTAYTQKEFSDCPYTIPDGNAIKAIAAYDPILGMLEGGTLGDYPSLYAKLLQLPGEDTVVATFILNDTPAGDWVDNPDFNEITRELVLHLPTYWIYARDHSVPAPPILMMDSEDEAFDFVHEVDIFSQHLEQNNIEYKIEHFTGVTAGDLVAEDSDIADRVVALADAFYREYLD